MACRGDAVPLTPTRARPAVIPVTGTARRRRFRAEASDIRPAESGPPGTWLGGWHVMAEVLVSSR